MAYRLYTHLPPCELQNVNARRTLQKGVPARRSGNPAKAGSFSHTFSKPGVFFFRSEVHQSLQLKINVMDCAVCTGPL